MKNRKGGGTEATTRIKMVKGNSKTNFRSRGGQGHFNLCNSNGNAASEGGGYKDSDSGKTAH